MLSEVSPHTPAFTAGLAKPLPSLFAKAHLWFALFLASSLVVCLSACGQEDEPAGLGKRIIPIGQAAPKGGGRYQVGKPYDIAGVRYTPYEDPSYDRRGDASWYGALFHGRRTANGEIFDMDRLSAAHPTLPLPVYVEVTNLDNRLTAVVRVNDRGPFRKGRLIDLSRRSAEVLGFKRAGTASVRVRYLRRAPIDGDDSFERNYLATRGYSQYASRTDDDSGPQVVIAVAPPGPPPLPPLPDRPDRSGTMTALPAGSPKPGPASELDRAGMSAAVAQAQEVSRAHEAWGAQETTGSIPPGASEGSVSPSWHQGPMIQAGTFRDKANAERARGALASVAPVAVTDVTGQGGRAYYRIEVGPFADGIEAASALSKVTDAGYRDAKIVLRN